MRKTSKRIICLTKDLVYKRVFCNNTKSLENKMTLNFVNESHLFTQGKTIATTYTITAREPSLYAPTCRIVIRPILVRTYHNSKTR